MHDTKERLSVLWIFALLNYLYADVVALFDIVGSRKSFDPLPPMGFDGFSGLDGNTHRHDSGVSTSSVSSEPTGEYHRRDPSDPDQRFPDFRCASARLGPATCFCRVPVLRNHRNCMHPDHHPAGVDLVRD
jgi:hypothetical protein